jgi:hypothetical protein
MFVALLRMAIAVPLAAAAAIGLASGIDCRYDWAASGASILMLAWAVRWVLGAAAPFRRSAAVLLATLGAAAQAAGFASAGAFFVLQSQSEQWWPFGWWPLVVGLLFVVVAAAYARDAMSGRGRSAQSV